MNANIYFYKSNPENIVYPLSVLQGYVLIVYYLFCTLMISLELFIPLNLFCMQTIPIRCDCFRFGFEYSRRESWKRYEKSLSQLLNENNLTLNTEKETKLIDFSTMLIVLNSQITPCLAGFIIYNESEGSTNELSK